MSQREEILALLKSSDNHKVSCRTFAEKFLFHKLATRCSELRGQGYDIKYIPSPTDSPLDAHYVLISEPKAVTTTYQQGQGAWQFMSGNEIL